MSESEKMLAVEQEELITLYTYVISPFAAKVHCFLLYKKLRFECFYVNPVHVERDLPIGRQVPVLTIGDQSLADSTPIGLWLDESFPNHPMLLPPAGEEREHLLEVDAWVSRRLIPGCFRANPGAGIDGLLNRWKLPGITSKTANGRIPLYLRVAMPFISSRIPFIKHLLEMGDDGLPVAESKRKLYDEFIAHLGSGPFVGGRDMPSLPDFAAYPQLALFYMTGFRGGDDIYEWPALMRWFASMRPWLTASDAPPLVPEVVRERDYP
ncbi:MAG: glutathione S-transferase family protein [Gammaproteobacteria bacterium]|nr:glutathione S-transferase family protein [Gammaproteobacteria bacterium]